MVSEGNALPHHEPQAMEEGKNWVDLWREPKGSRAVILGFLILVSIAAVDTLVYATGGTVYVWAHLMYLPIILAAAGFQVYGGVAAGLIGGLTLGPFMPLQVSDGTPQSLSNWTFRLGFFILVGTFSGLVSKFLNKKIDQLKEAKDQIHYILNNTKDVIFQIDLNGNYIYGNDAAERLTGYPISQLLQMNMMQLTALEYHPLINKRLQQQRTNGADEKAFEIEIKHKDGHRIWAELTTRKVYDRERKVVAIQGVARDITERKQAAEAMTLFRALVDHANDMIEVIDPKTACFLDINEKAGQVHGYTREEYLNLTVSDIDPKFHAGGVKLWKAHLEALQQFGFLVFESEHRRKDDSIFPVEINASYIRLERDYILAVVRDITERKRAERHIRQLNRVYAVLSGINELMVRERNPQKMFESACRIAVEKGGFRLAWIGRLKDSTQPIQLAAHAGATPDTLEALQKVFTNPALGCAFTKRALETGNHAVCNDVAHDPLSAPWRELALERGYLSLVSLPLNIAGHRAGTFNLYAGESGFFNADELHLLDELANNIGFSLEVHQQEIERQRAEQQIHRLNRLYAVLSNINVLIVHERDPQKIFESACKIAVEIGSFRMAWIGVPDEAAQILKPVASAGVIEGYLDSINIDLTNPARSAGPSGRALQTGEHQVSNDITIDPLMRLWREAALQRGYRSSTAFPLKIADKTVGVFTLHASETNFFDSEELNLLDELAADIGFALEVHQKELKRQYAENELRANEERFRLLIENLSDIITVINEKGVLKFVSPSVKRSLGYEPEELLNRNVFELMDLQDVAKTTSALKQVLADPTQTVSVEYRFRHRDGSWRILQSIGRNLPNQAPDGFIVVNSRDVTESRKLEEQFRQSQKMDAIGQLAGGVAHDFNNILAAMMMQAELSANIENLPKEAEDGLRQIRMAAERAANLTRQLLLFSRKQTMQSRDLDLNEVVKNIAKMLQRLIGANVQLQLQLHPAPLMTHADAGMLDQVLLNLVVNARDAMPQGGTVFIQTTEKDVNEEFASQNQDAKAGRYVCLTVRDTGTGISPEVLPKIFEPFFTTKEAGKGTGLGLATVFGIVKQHGGFLKVESEVGRGTTFQIFLPASQTASESPAGVAKSKPRGGTETILMVDDEEPLRLLTRAILERSGYKVLECGNGPEALELWEKNRAQIALLLTDLVMPGGVSGRELAGHLQQDKPHLKVVFISGYNAETTFFRREENFLQKPYPPDQLLQIVRKSLDG